MNTKDIENKILNKCFENAITLDEVFEIIDGQVEKIFEDRGKELDIINKEMASSSFKIMKAMLKKNIIKRHRLISKY